MMFPDAELETIYLEYQELLTELQEALFTAEVEILERGA